jgi:cell division protease FtsH
MPKLMCRPPVLAAAVPVPAAEPFATVPGSHPVSEATPREIDREVRRIVAAARTGALQLLRDERARLDHLATALLERETLDQDAAYRAGGLEPPTRPAPFPRAA